MIDTRTLVACVLVFVMETPLNSSVRVLVLMAAPKRERMARELRKKKIVSHINLNAVTVNQLRSATKFASITGDSTNGVGS